jgi:hypothetical protein
VLTDRLEKSLYLVVIFECLEHAVRSDHEVELPPKVEARNVALDEGDELLNLLRQVSHLFSSDREHGG